MRDTSRAAEYLFDEIGGIDDSYIAAAMSARPVRARRPSRIAVLAAAAVLVMAMVVALPMRFVTDKDDAAHEGVHDADPNRGTTTSLSTDPPAEDAEQKPDVIESPFELDSLLSNTSDSFNMGGEPDLFDGTPRLLWQTADGVLCGVKLSASELDHLNREQGKGKQVGDAAMEAEVMVWISYGNGLVVSPYLEDSPGNVGYGELFDYSPEIIPSAAVTGRIRTIIERQT